jgi:ankyrin repeat protein
LLKMGADPRVPNGRGETPLQLAAADGRKSTIPLLEARIAELKDAPLPVVAPLPMPATAAATPAKVAAKTAAVVAPPTAPTEW